MSACGRVVVNNNHSKSWPGDIHVGDEQLCSIHSEVHPPSESVQGGVKKGLYITMTGWLSLFY